MRYNELWLNKIMKKGYENFTVEEKITFNILNFIRSIHLNKQDFYSESFNSKFFGEIEMAFSKSENSLIGHCIAHLTKENRTINYILTENGFEKLDDVPNV